MLNKNYSHTHTHMSATITYILIYTRDTYTLTYTCIYTYNEENLFDFKRVTTPIKSNQINGIKFYYWEDELNTHTRISIESSDGKRHRTGEREITLKRKK